MERRKRNWKFSLALVCILAFVFCSPVLAALDDNSLSSLNIHNGTLSRDFQYDIWEYDVTVEPGTTELLLEPVTSDPNASVTSITGTVLVDGEATVLVNTLSESGIPMTYTLHVTESGDGAQAAEETEAPVTEAPQTETLTEETEPVTEAPQTEPATEAAGNALQEQMSKLRSDSDLMMKIVYGLIALSVALLFIIINLILKNKDLKDDLRDAENQLAYQTNEFARKERMMSTENYYAPTQQAAAKADPMPIQQKGAGVEETFGTRAAAGGYQGMQPEDVPPNRPITEEMAQPEAAPADKKENTQAEAAPSAEKPAREETAKSDVDITMVEL